VRFRHSPSFVDVLEQMRCSLLVSTYQAGKLIAIGAVDGRLRLSFHEFDQAMGVAANRETIAVGTRGQVWSLAANSQLAASIDPKGTYDRCYLARSSTVTGGIHCHELAWGEGPDGRPELWVVNTLFSCLVNTHPDYSFVPRWRPPFISELAAQDRCHLNGIGMRDGRPAFVTVMAQTDEPGGWRADKNRTGCVLDVASGAPITEGLAMPHSPRWHDGRLLVLNSGWGRLETVDLASGDRTPVEEVPGYARGLACHGNLAFVGLSRIRETAVFGGVPIAENHEDLKCGVGVIDLDTATTVATLEFESGVEEIFDVQVLPDVRCVALSSGRPGADQDGEIWVVPSDVDAGAPAAAGEPSGDPVAAQVAAALTAHQEGRPGEAVATLRRAAGAWPRSAEIANHLGNALQDAGDQDGAIEAYRGAAATDPDFGPALQNLGYLLINRGHTREGVGHLREAQRVNPLDVNRVMIATALPVVYRSGDALRTERARIEADVQALVDEGLEIDTERALVPTSFFTAYQGEDDRGLNERLGRIFRGVDLAEAAAGQPLGGPRSGGRHRIGLLSAYFRDHTIGRLNLGRVEHLSRESFEVIVLSATQSRDSLATAFERAADRFVSVPRDVEAARRLIAEQELDLLLFTDVGMDALTYTLAFSRMAPVQCATWGHPVTTGSPAIDYFLSSELLEAEGADAHYTEELVRLPTLGTYYHRPARPSGDGARARLGLSEQANVYACPQTLFKFHPDFDPILAGILRGDPNGVLVLIEGRVATWTELLRERFSRTMPDVQDRISWLRPLPREEFLNLLAVSDVALDPIGFGGGNTTYEALAVGTPVVTLPGELLRTRIARALYAKAGYTELVTESADEYIEKAVRLATDPEYASGVRGRIAEDCATLFEDDSEIRDLEEFLDEALGG
jgi:protein O-GlcNAc transferase